MLTMVSNSVDAALLVHNKTSDMWCVAGIDDTSRIAVPMHADDGYTEHSPLGLAICLTVQFQNNINVAHKWSVDWKMPFNDKKCKVIVFGSQNYRPTYRLGVMDWADTPTYRDGCCHAVKS